MTDAAPNLLYSIDQAGQPIAIIERSTRGNRQDVLDRYPGLVTGEHTTELAKLVNHFSYKFEYEVIEDPAAFAEAYRAQIASEDPNATWQQGVHRLRDFGMPDLDSITVPSFDGQTLVYYATSVRLGVPYIVQVPINGTEIGDAAYEPMEMSVIAD
ncbi:MAG: hypothetical protein AAGG09_05460 [Pseudomonadota bacterium]